MSAQVAALVGAHLSDRRRSLLAWGLPLGLMSAFIVAIFPSVEDALAKAIQDYPPALKEAFGIGELTNVEQYLHAEMLSLIVPLALGYLAVRAVAERPLRRRRKRPPRRAALGARSRGRAWSPPASSPPRSSWPRCCRSPACSPARQPARRRRPLGRPGRRRLRQRLAAGAALRRPRRRRRPAGRCGPASSPARSPGCWWRCT